MIRLFKFFKLFIKYNNEILAKISIVQLFKIKKIFELILNIKLKFILKLLNKCFKIFKNKIYLLISINIILIKVRYIF